jgi:hypothetical protein
MSYTLTSLASSGWLVIVYGYLTLPFFSTKGARVKCMIDSNSESCDSKTIRHRVFALLAENNRLSPKRVCAELRLPYVHYGRYINNLKSHWNSHYQFEQGSGCSSVHAWDGCCYVPLGVDRNLALEVGWKQTKAKNRWLLWKDKSIGRMMWFETGRVNLYVKSPVNLGKAKQLVCNGFSFTGLIFDNKVMFEVLETIRHSGSHYVFEIGYPLPKKTINYFEKSHGLTIKIGDKSHPTAVEVESHVPDWAERMDLFLEKLDSFFSADAYVKDNSKKPDYAV